MNTDYNVSPFKDVAVANTPPVIRFDESGPSIQGPIAHARQGGRAHDVRVDAARAVGLGR